MPHGQCQSLHPTLPPPLMSPPAVSRGCPQAALDSDEEDAEDKAKQRAWDDWADANPRGAGNSKLRPCA